jgi:hypothetical protein
MMDSDVVDNTKTVQPAAESQKPDDKVLVDNDFQEFKDLMYKRSMLCDTLGTLEVQKGEIIRQLNNIAEAQKRFADRIKKKLGVSDFNVDMTTKKVRELRNRGPI